MSIENIFKEWKRIDDKKKFVEDGIINSNLYKNIDLKILSFLSSAPDYSENYNFCQIIEEEFFYEFDATKEQKINRHHPIKGAFFNLARWIYAINKVHQNRIPLFSDVCCQNIKAYKYSQFLRASAIMFINKFEVKGRTTERKLTKVALRDKNLINREIKSIKPSLILCANTFNSYKKIYDNDFFEKIDDTNFFIHKVYGSKEIRYVYATNNPASKKKADEMFNELLNDFLNINVKKIIVSLKS